MRTAKPRLWHCLHVPRPKRRLRRLGGSWGGRLARLIGGKQGAHKDEHAPEEHRQRDVFVEEHGAPDHGAEGDQKGDGQ